MLKMVTSWAFLVVVANDVSVGSERHLAGEGGGLRKNVYEGFKSPAGVQLDPQRRDVLRLVDEVVEPR